MNSRFLARAPEGERLPFWAPEPDRPFSAVTIVLAAAIVAATVVAALLGAAWLIGA